jgi:hypothetical protein
MEDRETHRGVSWRTEGHTVESLGELSAPVGAEEVKTTSLSCLASVAAVQADNRDES